MSNKLFYGWWNVATGFVGMGLSYAMFTVFAFGSFVGPLSAEFGWSRGELSFAFTMTNIAVVIASPCLGWLIDRFGVRRILIPSIVLMALSVGSMAMLTANLWHFYAIYFLIPFLGAGTLPQSYSRVLIAWFNRRRGFALGLSLSGFGVGAMLVPALSQLAIDGLGWRFAYAGFALAIILLALPMAVFLMKETPEEMGLRADGDEPEANSSNNALPTAKVFGLTVSEAIRKPGFWLILGSFLLVGVGLTGVLAHLKPMLIDRGMNVHTASLCVSAIGFGIIFGRILAGYLMDYFFAPYVTAAFLLGMVTGIVILASGTSSSLVFLAALLVGMASGSEISEIAYICGRYFGPRAFGQIYGIMFAAFQIGAAFGAPLLGMYHDHAGNYILALWIIAALVFVGAVLITLLGPYPDLETQ